MSGSSRARRGDRVARVRDQAVDRIRRGAERGHETHHVRTPAVAIELESGLHQRGADRLRQTAEDDVGLRFAHHLDAWHRRETLRETARHVVRVTRVAQPQIVVQIRVHLRGKKAHLREQMARALAAIAHFGGQRRVEQYDGFGGEHAVFRRAERERVDARFPCHLGGRAAERDERVREARAIHVQLDRRGLADFADRRDFIERVDAAHFGGLRDARAGGLRRVHVADLDACGRAQCVGIEFRGRPVERHELRAVRVELGRAAFVVVDVAGGVAVDVAPGRRHRAQAQRVGGRAGRHEKHGHVALEDRGQPALDARGDLVRAVWARLARAARHDRFDDCRRCAGDVVARKSPCGRTCARCSLTVHACVPRLAGDDGSPGSTHSGAGGPASACKKLRDAAGALRPGKSMARRRRPGGTRD
ncbi:hypothetical protein PT2222_350037 [Paraburkholderia tropica]